MAESQVVRFQTSTRLEHEAMGPVRRLVGAEGQLSRRLGEPAKVSACRDVADHLRSVHSIAWEPNRLAPCERHNYLSERLVAQTGRLEDQG